jgi:hypothetical protein
MYQGCNFDVSTDDTLYMVVGREMAYEITD